VLMFCTKREPQLELLVLEYWCAVQQDVVLSNDGKWTGAPNADASVYSTGKDAAGNLFWKGFQRRTALGMEMYCSDAR